jgi:hypothetical protein
VLASLPRLQPFLQHLEMCISMENIHHDAQPLTALTRLTSCEFFTHIHVTMSDNLEDLPADPPPFFGTLPLLKELHMTSGDGPYEPLLVTNTWHLPQLTLLHLRDDATLSADSVLLSTLPALRELICCFICAPDDLPKLPPSLTRLECYFTEEDDSPALIIAEHVYRWTDAAPFLVCPHLSALRFELRFEGEWENGAPYTLVIPERQVAHLSECSIKAVCHGRRVTIRAPRSLLERLTAPGALEITAGGLRGVGVREKVSAIMKRLCALRGVTRE